MTQLGIEASNQVTPPVGDLSSVIHQCYQCGKCSAGCPVAPEMDLLPHQLVRLAVLGNMDRIVKSKSIWLCLTCHTCGARCPNGIDVPALLDPVRHQVLRENIATGGDSEVPYVSHDVSQDHQDLRPRSRAVSHWHVQDEDQELLFRHGARLEDVP